MSSKIDVLATALFEAYSRNSGNPPDCHYDRNAAEQWMAQALDECGVAKLIEALQGMLSIDKSVTMGQERERREEWTTKAKSALANAGIAP